MKSFSAMKFMLAFVALCLGVHFGMAHRTTSLATDAIDGAQNLAGKAGDAINGAADKVKDEVGNRVKNAADDALDAAGRQAKKQGQKLQQAAADQAADMAGQAEEIFWGLSTPWKVAVLVGVVMLLGCALVCVWSVAKQLFLCALVLAFFGLGVFVYFEWFYVTKVAP